MGAILQGLKKFKLDATGGSNIKSIQRGVINSFPASSTMDITISAVNVNNSVVEVNREAENNPDNVTFSIILLNSTTIRISRMGAAELSSGFELTWEVTEYNNVKSKQTGTFSTTMSYTEQTVAISPINPLKSKLIVSFKNGQDNSSYPASYMLAYRIVNSTSISFYGNQTVEWQVIEFN